MSVGSLLTELPQEGSKRQKKRVELQLCNRERRSNADEEEPGPQHIKEEEEELSASQDAEQFVVKQENGSLLLLQFKPKSEELFEVSEGSLVPSEEEMDGQYRALDAAWRPRGKLRRIEETEPDTGPAAADEEDSEASSASQPAPAQEMKKRKKVATAADGDRQYPWGDGHQDTMARFWLTHPIFYDKAQQHYKNKEMRKQLMQDLIQKNHKEWEKILTPLPTVVQVDAHLRNMRTRFVKLLKRKSAAPALTLSYKDQKIWERYQFLRPYIQRNRTTATHCFPGVQSRGDAAEDDIDEDPSLQLSQRVGLGGQLPSSSQTPPKGKGKVMNRRPLTSPTPSTGPDSEDVSEMEVKAIFPKSQNFKDDSNLIVLVIFFCLCLASSSSSFSFCTYVQQILQQAKDLISSIRAPSRSEHERRVRDFSRYMESEMLLIPESLWDECSFSIMNVIRGFKTAQKQGHLALSQHQAYQQSFGSQSYQQPQGGYSTQTGSLQPHSGTFQNHQQPGTFHQQSGTFQ
ncbi:uncharacterized protein LOC101174561 isoform X1 [Oryzias latipes]|uniref:uncharacterized protein LOC101174561 isoform X1 n=1 Tax=Oryzias latipes TaxID=8090 RepID=UPI000CE18220|nr:uncharacterized protein LOC101174561 isoform X1 [Oryzias latipes]